MLNRKISRDQEVAVIANDLGCEHALFLTWAIAHLDRDGRLDADPEVLRGMVTPLIGMIDSAVVASTIERAGVAGLIDVYEDDRGRRFLVYPKFFANQIGLRYDREPASDFPEPGDCRKVSGTLPEDIRKVSGTLPAEGKGREGKGIEGKGKEGNHARKLAESVSPAVIDDVWAWYKRYHPRARLGDKTRRLIAARLKEGSAPDDLKQAVDGYHRSPFHNGQNDSGGKYLGAGLIFRDSEHVTKGVEMATDETLGNGMTEKTKKNVSNTKAWLRIRERRRDQENNNESD